MKKISIATAILLGTLPFSVNAEIISGLGSGWSFLSAEDQSGSNYLNPGYGGQYFDAEYLLYKYDESSNDLTIALQTGFDIRGDNHQLFEYWTTDSGLSYWGGDIFLTFNDTTDLYALDFGQVTGGWSDRNKAQADGSIAAVDAGLYSVSAVSNDVYSGHTASNPLAMTGGTKISDQVFTYYDGHNASGYLGNNTSYAVSTTFNLDFLGVDVTQLDAQWTMSCGNDAIYGSGEIPPTSVPEPSSIALLSTGLIGLLGGLFVRRRRIQK